MISCGDRTDVRGEGGAGSISKIFNNKQQSLGPEWSMFKFGTSPPHNLDKPHGLVTSNTHTHTQKVILLV